MSLREQVIAMTDRTKDSVRWWLTVGGVIAAIAIAFTKLQGQAAELEKYKADRSELTALRADYDALRRVVDRMDARTLRMACRQNPNDLDCP